MPDHPVQNTSACALGAGPSKLERVLAAVCCVGHQEADVLDEAQAQEILIDELEKLLEEDFQMTL